MKSILLCSLFLIGLTNLVKSQTDEKHNSNPIVLSSIPLMGEGYEDVDLVLPEKGTYHFVLKEGIRCPEGYVIAIIDANNGNEFYLPNNEPHYFTVSRSVSKRLKMCLRKVNELPRLSASLVID